MLNLPRCYSPTWQTKSFIIPSVNVTDQLVGVGAVTFGRHFERLFKALTAGQ